MIYKKKLPDIKKSNGLKRQFMITVFMILFLLSNCNTKKDGNTQPEAEKSSKATSGKITSGKINNYSELIKVLRSVWQDLNQAEHNRFRQILDKGLKIKLLSPKISDILYIAFKTLAYEKDYKSKYYGKVSCYKPLFSGMPVYHRRSAYKQMELLEKHYQAGTIKAITLNKIKQTLAYDLETIYQNHQYDQCYDKLTDQEKKDLLDQEAKRDKVQTSPASEKAAQIIVDMQTKED